MQDHIHSGTFQVLHSIFQNLVDSKINEDFSLTLINHQNNLNAVSVFK